MANDEVKRLRAEIAKRRKDASNKINRIQKTTGAKLSGSEFDPRRQPGVENRMRSPERMKQYLSDLNDFMRRNNQFVAGTRGAPLPRGEYALYRKRATEARTAGMAHMAAMAGIETPGGVTIEASKAMLHPKADGGVKGPYSMDVLDPSQIPSLKALRENSRNVLKQLSSAYLPRKINEGRENLNKALTIMGEYGLIDRVNSLSDNAFDVMWFGSAFAEITFMKYDIEKERAAGTSKENWQNKVVDNAFDDISEFLDWATDLDNPGETTQGRKGKR